MAATRGVEEKQAGDAPKAPAAKRKHGANKAGNGKLNVKKARLGLLALLGVAAIVIGGAALLDEGSDDDSASSPSAATNAVALSVSELLAEVSNLGTPTFWVGPRAGTESYELSSLPDGRVYIRYLTGDAEAGDPRPEFLTVGTYPVAEAKKALRNASADAEGGQTLAQEDGYEVLSSPEATNAYIVFDDQPAVQIEIFSPQVGEAAQLATSGALKPVG
jgi:hypothetical protein